MICARCEALNREIDEVVATMERLALRDCLCEHEDFGRCAPCADMESAVAQHLRLVALADAHETQKRCGRRLA